MSHGSYNLLQAHIHLSFTVNANPNPGDLQIVPALEHATCCPPTPRLPPIDLPAANEGDDAAQTLIADVRSGSGDTIVEDLLMRA